MVITASGAVVRREPSGFTVVAWHRHDGSLRWGCEDDVYERLTYGEMIDVVVMHYAANTPGDPCGGDALQEERLF